MSRVERYELDTGRLLKLLAVVAVSWVPAMFGILVAASRPGAMVTPLVLGLAGCAAGAGLVTARTVHRRSPSIADATASDGGGARTWSDVANPRENFANRWAMYEDLMKVVGARDWSGKVVGEFGDTNEVLRSFMRGAEHRLFTYPEHDLQDLRNIPDGSLDVAVLDQTLEHVPDPERALVEVRRVLASRGIAIVTTPFLVPLHATNTYGDYYRWTPQGLGLMLRRCGFTGEVRMWGNRKAAAALLEDMYMTAETAMARGLGISLHESEANFPITVWVVAEKSE